MKKFELTSETKVYLGRKLFRIKSLLSFSFVKEGDLGGWIEKEDNLSHDGDAWVFGNAQVSGNAQVFGDAWVFGNAQVSGNAKKTPIVITGFPHIVTICDTTAQIGCQKKAYPIGYCVITLRNSRLTKRHSRQLLRLPAGCQWMRNERKTYKYRVLLAAALHLPVVPYRYSWQS